MGTDPETSNPETPHWTRFEPPLLLLGGGLDDLVARFLPGARAVGVEYLDQGVVNSNYRVDLVRDAGDPDRETVHLRLSRSDEGPLREGALGDRLGALISMPRLRGSERGQKPEPHRRSLFTWIEGRTLRELDGGASLNLETAARSLGRSLAVIHDVHPASFGRFATDLSVISSGDRPVARWADDLARRTALRLENPAMGLDPFRRESVRTRFARLLAPLWTSPPAPPSIVHGDLSPGNIILKAGPSGAPEFSGLIDWEMARAADPAVDFASLRFETGDRYPDFAAAAESVYREARGGGGDDDWERRIGLASVPLLLDARMVAWRRRDPDHLARIDGHLETALNGGGN